MALFAPAAEMNLIDFSASPPRSRERSSSETIWAGQTQAQTSPSVAPDDPMEDDEVTLCDFSMSPLHASEVWREPPQSNASSTSLNKSQSLSPQKSDSGFFEAEEDALITFDRDLEQAIQETETIIAVPSRAKSDKQVECIGKQRFVFYDIEDRLFTGTAKHLPGNKVLVKAAVDDPEYIITYDPVEIQKAAAQSWPDQSLNWRDKYTPRYSKLRQKPRAVERYVPRYSKLARRQSRWKKGIFRCPDAEDESHESSKKPRLDHSALFTAWPTFATGSNASALVTRPASSSPIRLYAIEIANLAPDTFPEDVQVAFSGFGSGVLAVKVLKTAPSSISMLAIFHNERAAQEAIKEMDQVEADGQLLRVQIARLSQEELSKYVAESQM